ncbi:MAG: thiamine-phosphate kinase [Acidobacteria bacterium]|nr:thiamine-phosphate kinase [Acidobacteriota bacterium]
MIGPFAHGEDAFLERLRRRFAVPDAPRGGLGIGDDAAVLPGRPRRVVTTDLLVEGQHFRFDLMTPADLAHRALEVNLSDIAAMGARPEAVFLGLGWPRGRSYGGRLDPFLAALARACRARGMPLLGGDTVRVPAGAATVALTVTGIPHRGGPVLRSGGRPGDVLLVTGALGGSALGLALLEGRVRSPREAGARRLAARAVARYRRPIARLAAAPALAAAARGLIDLSDGLGLDLPRLARASGCGFEVTREHVPVDPAAAHLLAPDAAFALAIGGGEDYELLAAVPSRRLPALRRRLAAAGVPTSPIGRLLPPTAGERLVVRGAARTWPAVGWDPFRPGRSAGLDARSPGSVLPHGRGRTAAG